MTDKTWKAVERRLARDVGTERVGPSDETGGPDFIAGPVCFQAKSGYRPPAYLLQWLDGIRCAAEFRRLLGAVVWKAKGAHDADALVFMRWGDWVQLFGEPRPSAAGQAKRTA